MAFYDWDRNGKKDIIDDYIEYNIYKDCTKNNQYSGNNNSGNSGCLLWFFIIIVILSLLSNCG